MSRITNPLSILDHVTSGRPFTLVGKHSRFAYKADQPMDADPKRAIYFVSLLTGPEDFSYFANLRTFGKADVAAWSLDIGRKSRVRVSDPGVKAFAWFWHHLVKAQGLNAHKLDAVEFYPGVETAPVIPLKRTDFDDPLDEVLPLRGETE